MWGIDESADALALRIDKLLAAGNVLTNFEEKVGQLGSYGKWGITLARRECGAGAEGAGRDWRRCLDCRMGRWRFCQIAGRGGFGYQLASHQFRKLQGLFRTCGSTPFPGGDKELGCDAPLGTAEADAYIDDMSMGANFATVNHLLINSCWCWRRLRRCCRGRLGWGWFILFLHTALRGRSRSV